MNSPEDVEHPIFEAAWDGNIEKVNSYLKAGFPQDALSDAGESLITLAVLNNRPEVARLLLDYGANPEQAIMEAYLEWRVSYDGDPLSLVLKLGLEISSLHGALPLLLDDAILLILLTSIGILELRNSVISRIHQREIAGSDTNLRTINLERLGSFRKTGVEFINKLRGLGVNSSLHIDEFLSTFLGKDGVGLPANGADELDILKLLESINLREVLRNPGGWESELFMDLLFERGVGQSDNSWVAVIVIAGNLLALRVAALIDSNYGVIAVNRSIDDVVKLRGKRRNWIRSVGSADHAVTLLELAVEYSSHEVVDFLLESGADPSVVNRRGVPLLGVAAARTDRSGLKIFRSLLEAGAQISPALVSENSSVSKMLHWISPQSELIALHKSASEPEGETRPFDVPVDFCNQFNKSLDEMCDSVGAFFRHGYGGTIRDIVFPDIYSEDDDASVMPHPGPKTNLTQPGFDIWGRQIGEFKYQWLPMDISIATNGEAKIESAISGVDKCRFPGVVEGIRKSLEFIIPKMECLLGSVSNDFFGDDLDPEIDDDDIDFRIASNIIPKKLIGEQLQVVCKIVEYRVVDEIPIEPSFHFAGLPQEHILATGILVLKRSENFGGGEMDLRTFYKKREVGWFVDFPGDLTKFELAGAQCPEERVIYTPENCIDVYSNMSITRSRSMFSWNGGEAIRRVLILHLINPFIRIPSTFNVTRSDEPLSSFDILRRRIALVAERRFHIETFKRRRIDGDWIYGP